MLRGVGSGKEQIPLTISSSLKTACNSTVANIHKRFFNASCSAFSTSEYG